MSKDEKSASKKPGKEDAVEGLPPLNLNAPGIDVGNAEHPVAVPPGRDPQPVRTFGRFTADVRRVGQWLITCGVDTVVMHRSMLICAGIGLFVALWFFPLSYFTGQHTYWTLPSGDTATNVVGMHYFLQEPWHFPLLTVHGLLYPKGANIAFTDSLPLMALLTKAMEPLWPSSANYLGLWMLIAYVAQGAMASFALSGVGRYSTSLHVCVAFLALLVPAFLVRLGHTALCSHFLILIAIGLAIRIIKDPTRQRIAYWFTPVIMASFLIHVYIAAMVASLFAASQIQNFWSHTQTRRLIGKQSLLCVIGMTAVYYLFGFYAGGSVAGGFGLYSMNLYSPFVPQMSSLFNLHDIINPTGGQYEGFNYVGAGLLALIALALFWAPHNLMAELRRYWSLAVLCVGLTLFALSTKVYAGSHLLLDYSHVHIALFDVFRCSGRFFWPVTYIALILSAAALWPQLQNRKCEFLLIFLVVLQISDSQFQRDYQHAWVTNKRDSLTALQHTARPIIEAHQRVTILPTYTCAGDADGMSQVSDLVFLASDKAIPVNTAYLGRYKDIVHCGREISDAAARAPEPNELLVFLKSKLDYYLILDIYNHPENCKQDSIYVYCSEKLPTLTSLTQGLQPFEAAPPGAFERTPMPVVLGRRINFNELNHPIWDGWGWSGAEKWGTWSDGDSALVHLALSSTPKNDLELLIHGHAFLTHKHPSEEVDILVNGHYLDTLKYDLRSNGGVRVVKILKALALEKNGQLLIKFNFKNPISPAEVGLSADARRLGLGIVSLELRAEMPIVLGRAISFNELNPSIWPGWSGAEKWGTWSDGDSALLLLALSSTPKNDLELLIDGHAFLTDKHPSQEVDVLVNGHHVDTLKYDLQTNSGVRVVKMPKALALEKNGQLLIRFNFKNPISPAELGLGTDARRLGLGIVSLELRAEN